MATSASSRPTRYSSGDYRGCMGGIMHLFDFNQALAGRKFLTDKKDEEGLEAAASTPDVDGSDIPEMHKSSTGKSTEIPFGHESRRGRKPSGTPIKSLIAQELEPEPSNRTPNVVARLMGLDALPADSRTLKKSPSVQSGERPSFKTSLDRKCHEEKLLHNVKTYAQKAITSPVHHLLDLAASKRPHKYRAHRESDIIGIDSLSVRNNIQEQQLQESQKDVEVWQNQKSGNHCSRPSMYDDLDLHAVAKHRLAHGKVQEAKLGISQETLSCTKDNLSQERLHESKEFLDAMDFLQCNKEFFMRFLQDPDTSFARHLQDDPLPTQPIQAAKYSQSYQSPDSYGSRSEAHKPHSWRKQSVESRRSHKSEQQLQKIPGADAIMEMNLASKFMEPSLLHDVSVMQDRGEMDISSTMHSRSRTGSADCHVPTRIVVLKPSPGRNRNLNSPSSNYPRAMKDPGVGKEIIREDCDVVLEELRERLRNESRDSLNHDKRNTWLSLNEHGREILKDQREIAQKIARQVKEYASRDSMVVNSGHTRSNNSTLIGTSVKRNQSSRSAIEEGSMASSSDGEMNVTERRFNCGQSNRVRHVPPCQKKQLGMQAEHERKEGRRRTRTLNPEQQVEMPVQVQNGFFRKSEFVEDNPHFFPVSKSSHGSQALGRHSVDGTNTSEKSSQIPFLVNADKDGIAVETSAPCEMDISYSLRHEVCSPKKLSRSRSVPMSSTSASGRWDEVSLNKAEKCVSESNKSHVETADLRNSADSTTGSIFGRKVSGLRGGFSMRRKQVANRECGVQTSSPAEQQAIQAPTPCEESASEKLGEDFCAARQKDQCQIQDLNIFVDNESSMLVDHIPLEAAMSAEDHQDAEGHVSQQFSKALVATDSSDGQSLEQQSQENNAEHEQPIAPFKLLQSLSANSSDVPASSNSELPKEKSEQPSPVSVLDMPFLEESESPTEFKEISCDLQELRMHLRLLKFDEPGTDLDPTEIDLDTTQDEDSLVLHENLVHRSTLDLDSIGGSVLLSSQPEDTDFTMEEVDCPIGKEPEMLYVKDVLVASGFTGDSTAILTRWYAPNQPLDHIFFQKVDGGYSCKESHTEGGHTSLNPGMRHLLFDRVNEVLLELLCPYLNHRPWMKHHEIDVSSMPTGKDLVKHVWSKICQFSCTQSKSQETLENLMTKDLAKAGQWIDLVVGIETVGLEVERAIFHDLIEETLLVL